MLRELLADPTLSARDIAGMLPGNPTRSMVIGKAHRLGLVGRNPPRKNQHGFTWTDAAVAELRKLCTDFPVATIAELAALMTGRPTPGAVKARLQRLRISRETVSRETASKRSRLRGKFIGNRCAAMVSSRSDTFLLANQIAASKEISADTPVPVGSMMAAENSVCLTRPPVLSLERWQCRYPTGGERASITFCCADRAPGSPYCPQHSALAFRDHIPGRGTFVPNRTQLDHLVYRKDRFK